jgi:hypothetical protein
VVREKALAVLATQASIVDAAIGARPRAGTWTPARAKADPDFLRQVARVYPAGELLDMHGRGRDATGE